MKEQDQFDWVDFYEEFAIILLDYKDKRIELIDKVKVIYGETGIHPNTQDPVKVGR